MDNSNKDLEFDLDRIEREFQKVASYNAALDLSTVSTKRLSQELETRLGVKVTYVDPYEDATISVNGPAIVLIITD